jgi:hypothetical protein
MTQQESNLTGSGEDMADSNKPVGVTKDIVESFLAELSEKDVDDAVVNGLKKTLLEDGKSTKVALEKSLFPEE